ncbi:MAG: hypothetical protein QOK40_1112 [Miltoncostaeaceae bacterium]|jgi:hypothetical protein|nr:hypothetical protein [Miltoncostaeaceae bacterium]
MISESDIDGIAAYGRFEHSPVALAFVRPPNGVIEFLNAAAQQLLGPRAIVGQPVSEAVPELEGQGCLELLERAFAGEPLQGLERPVLLDAVGDGRLRIRYLDVQCEPLRGPTGEVRTVAVLAIDVTDPVLDRRQLGELSEQLDGIQERAMREQDRDSSLLSRALAYEDELGRVAGLLVPAVADLCVVDVRAGEGGLRRLAVADADPRRTALVRELERRPPPAYLSEHPIWTVLETGRPVIVPDASDSLRKIVLALREREGRSYVCLPLVSRGRTIGAVSLISSEPGSCGRSQVASARAVMRRVMSEAETRTGKRGIGGRPSARRPFRGGARRRARREGPGSGP